MRGGSFIKVGREWRAQIDYDADELRALADAWGPRDAASAEALELADELDRRNAPDPDAPGLRFVVTGFRP
jgi:hypothetical protein